MPLKKKLLKGKNPNKNKAKKLYESRKTKLSGKMGIYEQFTKKKVDNGLQTYEKCSIHNIKCILKLLFLNFPTGNIQMLENILGWPSCGEQALFHTAKGEFAILPHTAHASPFDPEMLWLGTYLADHSYPEYITVSAQACPVHTRELVE